MCFDTAIHQTKIRLGGVVLCALSVLYAQAVWATPQTETPPTGQQPRETTSEAEVLDEEAAQLGVLVAPSPGLGVLVSGTIWGSPAAQAGLRGGDYIMSIDGTAVSSPEELRDAIRSKKPGSEVRLVVWRRGKETTKDVALASRSPEPPVETRAWLGVVLEPSDGPGARIARIHPVSPAARAGLRHGDVVLQLQGTEVPSVDQIIERIEGLQPDSEVELLIRRDDAERKLTVTLGSIDAAPRSWLREAFRAPRGAFESAWPPEFAEPLVPLAEYQRLQDQFEDLQRQVEELREEVQRLKGEPDESKAPGQKNPGSRRRAYREYYGFYGPYYTYPAPRRYYSDRVPRGYLRRPLPYQYYRRRGRAYYYRYQGPHIYGPRFGVRIGRRWMLYW